MQFILGEGSRVRERLADVLNVEVGKFLDDLCGRHTVGDEVDHVRNGNPKPTDGGPSGQNTGDVRDSIVGTGQRVLKGNSSAVDAPSSGRCEGVAASEAASGLRAADGQQTG